MSVSVCLCVCVCRCLCVCVCSNMRARDAPLQAIASSAPPAPSAPPPSASFAPKVTLPMKPAARACDATRTRGWRRCRRGSARVGRAAKAPTTRTQPSTRSALACSVMNLPVVTRVSPVPSGITTQRRMQPAPSAPTSSATTPRPLVAPSTIARALAVWCAGSALSFPFFFVFLFVPVFYFFLVMFFVRFIHLIVLMHHSVSKNASVRPQLELLSTLET